MHMIISLVVMLLFSNSVAALEKQEFSYGEDPKQAMDIYFVDRPVGIIVMLHGGAWRTGDKSNAGVWRNKVAYWGQRGYIFASVNTRLLPSADPVEQAWDLAAAMSMAQDIGRQRGVVPDQMILMGHSAGGHVAALVAAREDIQQSAGLQPWAGTVLLDSAALDVTTIMTNAPSDAFRRAFGSNPAFWTAASPSAYLDALDGPFLVVCSQLRRIACPAARSFGHRASGVGVETNVMAVRLRHAEINQTLGRRNAYTDAVRQWIEALP